MSAGAKKFHSLLIIKNNWVHMHRKSQKVKYYNSNCNYKTVIPPFLLCCDSSFLTVQWEKQIEKTHF